jgi:molybdenum cofactor biosynthesis enzyme MoaA
MIAVRSLQCEDHANNIPPNVLQVLWMHTRRCNYDCSYCSPHYHDFISPFPDSEKVKRFFQKINSEALLMSKTIKWIITGGEPFVDPNFLSLLLELHNYSTTKQINVTTNGSASLDNYVPSLKYIDGLTISLHLERQDKEINKTVEKIIFLSKNTDRFINVNLMFLPGKLEKIKNIIEIFESNNVKYVLRKLHPRENDLVDDALLPNIPNKKYGVPKSFDEQIIAKQAYMTADDEKTTKDFDKQYSKKELEYLDLHTKIPTWNNIGVWTDQESYYETNTDNILIKNAHNFNEWTCFAGVDMLYIDHDGHIYRGRCCNGGIIGNIETSDKFFLTTPTICEKNWCGCNTDMSVRKCKTTKEYNLIGANK